MRYCLIVLRWVRDVWGTFGLAVTLAFGGFWFVVYCLIWHSGLIHFVTCLRVLGFMGSCFVFSLAVNCRLLVVYCA